MLRYLKFNTANMSKIKGKAFFDVAVERGLEGIVGKDGTSPYISGYRTGSWVKFKNYRVQEFQIERFTGSRHHIESLLFGLFRDGDFIYVGQHGQELAKRQASRGSPI